LVERRAGERGDLLRMARDLAERCRPHAGNTEARELPRRELGDPFRVWWEQEAEVTGGEIRGPADDLAPRRPSLAPRDLLLQDRRDEYRERVGAREQDGPVIAQRPGQDRVSGDERGRVIERPDRARRDHRHGVLGARTP